MGRTCFEINNRAKHKCYDKLLLSYDFGSKYQCVEDSPKLHSEHFLLQKGLWKDG